LADAKSVIAFGRLGLGFGHLGQLGQGFLGPFARDFSRLLGSREGNARQLLVQGGLVLEGVLKRLGVNRERAEEIFEHGGEVLGLGHDLSPFSWSGASAVFCN
jgi:hypothetical protein